MRAGAIVPLGPIRQHLGAGGTAPGELWLHPGTDGRFVLYEDDGDTFDYRKGRYRLTEFRWDDAARRLSIALLAGPSDPLPPEPRRYIVRVAGRDSVETLRYDGRTAASLTI